MLWFCRFRTKRDQQNRGKSVKLPAGNCHFVATICRHRAMVRRLCKISLTQSQEEWFDPRAKTRKAKPAAFGLKRSVVRRLYVSCIVLDYKYSDAEPGHAAREYPMRRASTRSSYAARRTSRSEERRVGKEC